MKRKLSLTDILSNLTLNEDNKKQCIVKNIYIVHKDVFNIGKIHLEKEFYSKNEVLMILNTREDTLYEKFIKLIKHIVCHTSIDKLITIPKWIN